MRLPYELLVVEWEAERQLHGTFNLILLVAQMEDHLGSSLC